MATSDGLHIRWRETAPDQGLLTFALSELDDLHGAWPEPVQCNIIMERSPVGAASEQQRYRAHVEIKLGRRKPSVLAKATGDDPYAALRRAFGDLHHCTPFAAPAAAPALASEVVAA